MRYDLLVLLVLILVVASAALDPVRVLLASSDGSSPSASSNTMQMLGDIDCDSDADTVDALVILQWTVGRDIDPSCLNAADVQCDDDIDPADALVILRFVASLTIGQAGGCPPVGVSLSPSPVPNPSPGTSPTATPLPTPAPTPAPTLTPTPSPTPTASPKPATSTDLKLSSAALNAPAKAAVGQTFDVTVSTTARNAGPASEAIADVKWLLHVPTSCSKSPDGGQRTSNASLDEGASVTLTSPTWKVACKLAEEQKFAASARIELADASLSDPYDIDNFKTAIASTTVY